MLHLRVGFVISVFGARISITTRNRRIIVSIVTEQIRIKDIQRLARGYLATSAQLNDRVRFKENRKVASFPEQVQCLAAAVHLKRLPSVISICPPLRATSFLFLFSPLFVFPAFAL